MIDHFEDADDVGDVSAESGKRLLDGLFITDVSINRFKEGQFRAALCGDVKSALRHDHQQADRFE